MRSFCYLKYTFNKTLYYNTKISENECNIPVIVSFFIFQPTLISPHGWPIKGDSVCIQAEHAWISWCKTTCTLIHVGVLNICMFKGAIFPHYFALHVGIYSFL